MTDAESDKQTSREPSQSGWLAACGVLLFALVVGFAVAMNRWEEPLHDYFREIPGGKLYWDKYVEGLAFPILGVSCYVALLVGTGMIVLTGYRAVRALVSRER